MENRIERILITPAGGNNFEDQLLSILNQIDVYKTNNDQFILQLSFFIDANNNIEYLKYYHHITGISLDILNIEPSISIIAQAPANGIQVSLELILLTHKSEETRIVYKKEKGVSYTLVQTDKAKEVYAGGVSSRNFEADFSVQVDECYQLMESILSAEKLAFSDIVRQWNYVENILSLYKYGKEHVQHYQVLNDIRSKYYSKADFYNGYPAATGIGMDSGGPILEFYAVQSTPAVDIVPIKNPKQIDAYDYSEAVLVGDALEKHHKKTTPKFERAKYCSVNGISSVFISGTAAIQNEKTLGINDIRLQTEITLENIANLIDKLNLENMGIRYFKDQVKYTFIRVYIKEKKNIPVVGKICSEYYGNIPIHYLVADICRDDLLLEIEGVAEIG